MEPCWSYEDIGAFFFVLVVVAALVRLGIRTHLLGPSALVAPSLTLQTSIIIFLGIALYAILKRRRQKPVIAPLGWGGSQCLLYIAGGRRRDSVSTRHYRVHLCSTSRDADDPYTRLPGPRFTSGS